MEYYDVIIVGAGIAGTTLSKDLTEICPNYNVLLIDGKSVGNNIAYGIRTTFEETLKKYDLPYIHKYKTWKVGAYDEVFFELDNELYLVDYKEICCNRLRSSNVEFRQEMAIDAKGNTLLTNKNRYRFKYLIDCAGANFFLKKIFKKPLPFMYWLVHSKVIKRDFDFRITGLSDKSCYFFFSDNDFVEDLYPLKNKILEGEWSYSRSHNFLNIKPHDRTILKKIPNPKIISTNYTCIPVSATSELVHKNYALLGDSFGNADPYVGIGIDMISDSSRMLANAIKKRDLALYEKQWKNKYLEREIRCLTSKLDRYHNTGFIKWIKNYPELSKVMKCMGDYPYFFQDLAKNELNVEMPPGLKKIFPKRQIFFQFYNYIKLKLEYKLNLI